MTSATATMVSQQLSISAKALRRQGAERVCPGLRPAPAFHGNRTSSEGLGR